MTLVNLGKGMNLLANHKFELIKKKIKISTGHTVRMIITKAV
jgi:hypothetical protein